MKNRGKDAFYRIRDYLLQAVDWLIDWLQHFAISVYRKTKKRSLKTWRDIKSLRWHNVKRDAKDKFFATYDYFRHTPPKQMAIDVYDSVMTAKDRLWRYFTKNNVRKSLSSIALLLYGVFLLFTNFFANPRLVQETYQINFENSAVYVEQITQIYNLARSTPTGGELLRNLDDAADSAVEQLEPLEFKDPHPWIVRYAVKDFVEGAEEAARVTSIDGDALVETAIDALNEHAELGVAVARVLEIRQPVNNVDAFLNQLKLFLGFLENNDFEFVDTTELKDIGRVLIAESEQFISLSDRARFEANSADFTDELSNSATELWKDFTFAELAVASELKFDYERFNSYLLNNLPEEK